MDGDGIWVQDHGRTDKTLPASQTDFNLTLIQCIRRERSDAILYEEYIGYRGRPLMKPREQQA